MIAAISRAGSTTFSCIKSVVVVTCSLRPVDRLADERDFIFRFHRRHSDKLFQLGNFFLDQARPIRKNTSSPSKDWQKFP